MSQFHTSINQEELARELKAALHLAGNLVIGRELAAMAAHRLMPFLIDMELFIGEGERITRRNLNEAYRMGFEQGQDFGRIMASPGGDDLLSAAQAALDRQEDHSGIPGGWAAHMQAEAAAAAAPEPRYRITRIKCPACDGDGTGFIGRCLWCDGSGRMHAETVEGWSQQIWMIAGGGYVAGDHDLDDMRKMEAEANAARKLIGLEPLGEKK